MHLNTVVPLKLKKQKPVPLTPIDAQRRINGIAQNSSYVIILGHASERMEERSFVFRDVIEILREGIVLDAAEYDEEHNNYKYKVTCINFRGNRDADVIVTLRLDSLAVITVMWID